MILTTKIEKIIVNDDFSEIRIPPGVQGTVIDIIIENCKASFLLDFAEYETFEWYTSEEVEDKF